MFTIKQRSYRPLENQLGHVQVELIDGPFDLVSQEVDDAGYIVVHAHRGENMLATTFGPYKGPEPRPTLWVMNEAGATVATYHL